MSGSSKQASHRGDDDLQSCRRFIIKSLVVVLNFSYTHKYLADIVSSYSKASGKDATPISTDIFGGKKNLKPSPFCVLEEKESLVLFRDQLLQIIAEARAIHHIPKLNHHNSSGIYAGNGGNRASITSNLGSGHKGGYMGGTLSNNPDFRDLAEDLLFFFSSLAMSMNFTDELLCDYVLAIGQAAISHCKASLQNFTPQQRNFSASPNLNVSVSVPIGDQESGS
mmetsp:Transcript_16496/g.25478  ORF Transcript_16496/g.25478 Transcript_16496/m.25478 type:complete len:224 (-) Transcript_16496:2575-3246(-)